MGGLNLLVTTLEEVHRPGATGLVISALRHAARGGKVTAAGLASLINGSTVIDQLATDATRLLALGSSLPLCESQRVTREIKANVPLAEPFGYTVLLRSLSQGRGTCVLEPAGFRPAPGHRGS